MLYICPSRGRPQNAARLVAAWNETRTFAKLLIAVDEDDPALMEYFHALTGWHTEWFTFAVGPRLRFGGTLNRYARNLLNGDTTGILHGGSNWGTPPSIFGALGDDHVPRTVGFDQQIKDAMNAMGGTGVVYGNDLIQGANLPTAVAMSADIVRALGYMSPPEQRHLYIDDFWKFIGHQIGRLTYLPDVVIAHLHPVGGTAEWDDGYREVNSGETYAEDFAAFETWKSSRSAEELSKLRALL